MSVAAFSVSFLQKRFCYRIFSFISAKKKSVAALLVSLLHFA
ncbi:hypothetical protein ABEKA_3307 (plasmid) [Acinetobacter lwoffii]|nr:hypothetical protein ABEKA_3307 [Acinetobacter lwoffii]